MSKPDFIPESDWNLVLRYANNFENEPYLIAGIGWHETHWGRLGAGKIGFILGYGYWPGSTVKEKYRGLTNQLKGANNMLVSHLRLPIILGNVTDFAVNHWKSSAPRSWASSVYSIYSSLAKGETPQYTDTEIADLDDRINILEVTLDKYEHDGINDLIKRVTLLEVIINFIKNLIIQLAKEFKSER